MVSQPGVARAGRVLVLGSDTRSFLSVIRSLGRAGLEVHLAWCPMYSASISSKYIKAVHEIPYYCQGDRGWIASFNELLCKYEFDLVMPCDDAALLPLQLNRHDLTRENTIYLLNDLAYRTVTDKERTYALAQSLGISLPRQAVVTGKSELCDAIQELGYPAFAKPFCSAEADDPWARQAVKKIDSFADVQLVSTGMLSRGPALIQQCFEGIGVGVETLCCDGEVLVAFQHERVHEPHLGGGSSYRKSVPLNSELLDATRGLLKALNYSGVAMVEFRYNRRTKKWVLLEVNGRFWGSLPLAVAAGVDFPRYLYEMLLFSKKTFSAEYRPGIYCRNWRIDLGWVRANATARKSNTAGTMSAWQLTAEFWNVVCLREHSDTLTLDDPGPGIEEIIALAARAGETVVSRLLPARRSIRRRALSALQNASRLLFVCKGNICRGPFAERYLRTVFPNIQTSSAGLLPSEARTSPKAAVAAALAWNIDLTEHRSRTLRTNELGEWDIVFVFELEQLRAVKRMARRANVPTQVLVLGDFDVRGPLQIADPFGGDSHQFEATYDRIARLVDMVAASLASKQERTEYVTADEQLPICK